MKQALDIYDDYPYDMLKYLRNYGWHFNKKACELAVSMMKKKDPASGKKKRIEPWKKEAVDELLKINGVELENNTGYDHVYVANMCKADNFNGSVPDEAHLAMYVREIIDDADAGDGEIMRCWYAKVVSRGEVIDWEELV